MIFLLFMWAVLIALGVIAVTSGAYIVGTFSLLGSVVILLMVLRRK